MSSYIQLPRSALTDELWRNKDLAALLCYLITHADENGEFQSSLTTVATELKITPQQFKTLWKKLESNQVATKLATKSPTKLATKFILNIQINSKGKQPCKQRSKQPSEQPSSNQVRTIEPAYISPSFVAPEFAETWRIFVEYRKEIRKPYKSESSERTAYNKMVEMANNDPIAARDMVERTILGQWQGLFPKDSHGTKPITSTDTAATRTQSRDRLRTLASGVLSQSADKLLDLYNGSGENPDTRQNKKPNLS